MVVRVLTGMSLLKDLRLIALINLQSQKSLRKGKEYRSFGFTLLEIVIVIVILGLVSAVVLKPSGGSFTYWQQEGAMRKLSEQINFLYYQAITDGVSYRMEFGLSAERQYYQIGQMSAPVEDFDEFDSPDSGLSSQMSGSKMISAEIDNFLNPLPADFGTMQAPENIPSLAEPIYLPDGMYFEDIRTVRGDYTSSSEEDMPFLTFSPRGYAEFTVIHLKLARSDDAFVTLVVNPFTGICDIYREYKVFEWNYGSKE